MIVAAVLWALAATAVDLPRAEALAHAKQFAEAEALYREIVAEEPQSRAARLGLARVVMWQGRYAEAIRLFDAIQPADVETLEGRATAAYWSGDFRTAAREFRRVLELDPQRELSRRSLGEIESVARPTQKVTIGLTRDDQPFDALVAEASATFFSDPLTEWSVTTGGSRLDAERLGDASASFLRIGNQTRFGRVRLAADAGAMRFPDGETGFIGGASVNVRPFTLSIERRAELAAATSIRTHATSTTTSLRWDLARAWLASAEVSHRRYFDDNSGWSAVAWGVAPLWREGSWTFWGGLSAAARDTDESRFTITAIASVLEDGAFRYQYRAEYDPYWTPNDLIEGRVVAAIERRWDRGSLKLQADGGYARDRGRAFGPDSGSTPFPEATWPVAFDRQWRPFRVGLTTSFEITPSFVFEAGATHGATVDYRSTSVHASLVRRH